MCVCVQVPLLPERLHLQLFCSVVGLAQMAERNRLDGAEWDQPASGFYWSRSPLARGMCKPPGSEVIQILYLFTDGERKKGMKYAFSKAAVTSQVIFFFFCSNLFFLCQNMNKVALLWSRSPFHCQTCCFPSGLQSSGVEPVRDWGILLWSGLSRVESHGKYVSLWRTSATVLAREPALAPSKKKKKTLWRRSNCSRVKRNLRTSW